MFKNNFALIAPIAILLQNFTLPNIHPRVMYKLKGINFKFTQNIRFLLFYFLQTQHLLLQLIIQTYISFNSQYYETG